MALKSVTKAHIAVIFTNIFFGGNYSLVKYISPSVIGPYGLNLIRVVVSVLLFWILWLTGKSMDRAGNAGIQKKHWVRFLLCGLTGVAINQMLFIKGLTLTSTIHASLLILSTPLLITVFAFWALGEKITWLKSLGLVLGIGGAALLMTSKEKSGEASLIGDLLLVINAISYAVYFILVRPLMKAYSSLHVMRWVFTFGMFMILPFAWTQFSEISWVTLDWTHFASLAFVVVLGTFVAYSFNLYGIQHLGAGVTGSYIYSQPIFAALIATFFLGEQFTAQMIIAAIMIFVGVFLVGRRNNG